MINVIIIYIDSITAILERFSYQLDYPSGTGSGPESCNEKLGQVELRQVKLVEIHPCPEIAPQRFVRFEMLWRIYSFAFLWVFFVSPPAKKRNPDSWENLASFLRKAS